MSDLDSVIMRCVDDIWRDYDEDGSGELDKYRKSPVKSRILQYAKGSTKSWLNDIVDQIDETISKHKITDL